MFCTKCGAQIADNARFCTSCGATLETSAPVVTPVAEPAPAVNPVPAAEPAPATNDAPAVEPTPAEPKERTQIDVNAVKTQLSETLKPVTGFLKRIWANKVLSFGIIGGFALILVVCIVFSVLDATGYKSSLNNFIDMMNGDTSKVELVMPKDYWEYMDDEFDKDLDDIIDNFEDELKDLQKEQKSTFGKNIKYSYTIEEAKKVDKDDVKDIAEALAESYEFVDEDDVTEAYEVEIELTIKGSKDDDSDDMEFVCVKIGSGWYLLSSYSYGDTDYYRFFAISFVN